MPKGTHYGRIYCAQTKRAFFKGLIHMVSLNDLILHCTPSMTTVWATFCIASSSNQKINNEVIVTNYSPRPPINPTLAGIRAPCSTNTSLNAYDNRTAFPKQK